MAATLLLGSRLLTGAGLWTERVQRRGSSAGHRGPPATQYRGHHDHAIGNLQLLIVMMSRRLDFHYLALTNYKLILTLK